MIALSSARLDIGVDVEEMGLSEAEIRNILPMLHTNEQMYLHEQQEKRAERFYSLWTAKEAFLKAVGTGISHGLQNTCLLPGSKGIEAFL